MQHEPEGDVVGQCCEGILLRFASGEQGVKSPIDPSHEPARSALFVYLEVSYNRLRQHSPRGYVSPRIDEQWGEPQIESTV